MSFNARLFNHYKWIKNENIPADIKEFVFKKKPDLLAIQEYHGDYQYLLDSFKNKHIHLSGNNVGQSIHTNYKIIELSKSMSLGSEGLVASALTMFPSGSIIKNLGIPMML